MLTPKGGVARRGPLFESKPPDPKDIAIVPPKIIAASMRLGERLKPMKEFWGIGGDAGLVLHGVPVDPENLEVVTNKEGVDFMVTALQEKQVANPAVAEVVLPRQAEVEGKQYPVLVRSYYTEMDLEGVKVKVYGDKQIKVGEWDWGDPLVFKPEVTQVLGVDVNLVPLILESELTMGLGWVDLSRRIADTIASQKHRGLSDQGPSTETT